MFSGAREAQQNKVQLSNFSRNLEISIFNLKPRGRRIGDPRVTNFFSDSNKSMSRHPKILAGAREAQGNKDQLSSFSRSLEISIFMEKQRGRRIGDPRVTNFFSGSNRTMTRHPKMCAGARGAQRNKVQPSSSNGTLANAEKPPQKGQPNYRTFPTERAPL